MKPQSNEFTNAIRKHCLGKSSFSSPTACICSFKSRDAMLA